MILSIPIREVREICIPIEDHKGKLPLDFEKIYYACGNSDKRTIIHNMRNPFDNSVDSDVVYEAKIASGNFGDDKHVTIQINRLHDVTVHEFASWVQLDVSPTSSKFCFSGSPLRKHRGKPSIYINDDNTVETPFKKGELYVMYVANMKDKDGKLLFPFHPLITPWYEWCVKEKVVTDAIFNTEGGNYGDLLKIAKQERLLAWIDAFNASTEKEVAEHSRREKEKELKWYNQYFKHFQ
jgi:hypothetical protein